MSKLEGMYFNHILDLSIKKVVAVVFFPRAKNRKLYQPPPPAWGDAKKRFCRKLSIK